MKRLLITLAAMLMLGAGTLAQAAPNKAKHHPKHHKAHRAPRHKHHRSTI